MTQSVSILIPTYNRAEYLREAIRSALAQTHPSVEIIVLDDAGTDHTPAVVAEFAGDPRLRSIRHARNIGIVNNWRAGFEAATGGFFCLLHDDDTFEPTFVETLLRPLADDPGLILAFSDHWVMDAQGKRLPEVSEQAARQFGRSRLTPGRLSEWGRTALVDSSLPVGATLFRAGAVRPEFLDERAQGAIDSWLFYQCVKTGASVFYCPDRLMNYRLHDGGMSRSAVRYMGDGHLFRYRRILDDPEMAPLHPAIRAALSAVLASQGVMFLVQGRPQDARRSLRQSLGLRFSRRAALAYGLTLGGRLGTQAAQALKRN